MQACVDGGAFIEGAHRCVRGTNFRVMAFAAEQRVHEPVLLGVGLGLLDEVANARKALEVLFDVGAGLLARNAELVGETERRNSVDDAEVDRLGAAADLRRHALDRHAEHFRGGHSVNVEPFAKGFLQRLDAGDLGKKPQLDLRIVGGHKLHARRGDEGAADLAAVLGTHRNVLQIGIGRRQPAGRCRSERVVGVHPMGGQIDEAGQRVRVGRFQLRHLPPVEDHLRQLVALLSEVFERARPGRPLPSLGLGAARQSELAVKNIAELLGAAGIDGLAGFPVDLGFQPCRLLRKLAGEPREHLAVDGNAAALHAGKHGHERPLQGLVNGEHALGDEPRLQRQREP